MVFNGLRLVNMKGAGEKYRRAGMRTRDQPPHRLKRFKCAESGIEVEGSFFIFQSLLQKSSYVLVLT